MTTIIVLILTYFMIRIHIISLLRTKGVNIKAQEDMMMSLRETADQGVPISVLKNGIIASGILLALVFITFFTVSSIIIGENWAGIAAATFSVLNVRQALIAIEIVKTETIKIDNLFDKFTTLLGLIYSSYFLFYYSNLKLPEPASYVVVGIVIVYMIISLHLKKIKKARLNN